MSKLTIRNLIISSVFLLVTLGAFAFVLHITEKENSILTEQLIALEKKQAQEKQYLKLKRIASDSAEDRALLDGYFLSQESDSIDFLNKVESLAPQLGVNLKTDNLKKEADKKTKEEWLTLQFSFSGTYERVTNFIKILENLPYIAEVTQVSLESKTPSDWSTTVNMRVNLYTYDDKE